MGFTDNDRRAISHVFSLRQRRPASYEKLKEYASKVVYVHGKFYDIDENGQVDNMDYPKSSKLCRRADTRAISAVSLRATAA